MAIPSLRFVRLSQLRSRRLCSADGLSAEPTGRTKHAHSKAVNVLACACCYVPAGSLVYDPFCGEGASLVACEQTGRMLRGVEIDPHRLRTAVDRWHRLTGEPVMIRRGRKQLALQRRKAA